MYVTHVNMLKSLNAYVVSFVTEQLESHFVRIDRVVYIYISGVKGAPNRGTRRQILSHHHALNLVG